MINDMKLGILDVSDETSTFNSNIINPQRKLFDFRSQPRAQQQAKPYPSVQTKTKLAALANANTSPILLCLHHIMIL